MFFMSNSQMHTLYYTIKLIALHSFMIHTLTLLSMCSVFKARQYRFNCQHMQAVNS